MIRNGMSLGTPGWVVAHGEEDGDRKMKQAGLFLRPFRYAILLAMAASYGAAGFGQVNGVPAASNETASNPATTEALQAFEAGADEEYELGSGDEITIDVNGRPELSGKRTIGPDGRITLPVAGDLKLAGKTRGQAGKDIQAALSTYYQDITVSLSVDRYTSNHILVLGAVEHPGLMLFDDAPTLLEVIARSGSAQASAATSPNGLSPQAGSLAPVTVPERCVLYRKGQAVLTVELRKLLKDGDPLANLRLKRDDIVFVPGDSPYVSVLGNVMHAGLVRLDSTSTLPQILAQSGGLSDKSGRYPKILIVHPGAGSAAGSMETVSFKDVLDPKPHPLDLHSGDIIYVPESGFNRASDSLQKISPLLTLITLGALLD
jgi:polysaccharide export outer membrane protein